MNNLEILFDAADNVINIYNVVNRVAKQISYPDIDGLNDAVQALNRQIFLIANHSVAPESTELAPEVIAKKEALTI